MVFGGLAIINEAYTEIYHHNGIRLAWRRAGILDFSQL